MSVSIWENIDHLNFKEYECIKKGFLRNNHGEISFFRDKESRLLLKVVGEATVKDFNFNDREGEIPREEFQLEFKHHYFEQKILMLAIPESRKINQIHGKNSYIDIYVVDEFEFTDNDCSIEAEYLIEFLDGLKIDHIFPHSMEINETHEKRYELLGENLELIEKIINKNSFTKNGIRIKIEDDEVYIIKLGIGNRGLILYRKNLELFKRDKIRKIISYIFGCPLVFYGYTLVNKYMTPSYSYLRNIHDNERGQLAINVQVPTPLSLSALNIIEVDIFENLMQELYVKYEEYDLSNIFFTYWVAVNSNSITAAVHYGALIEKLQATYMKIHEVSYSKILDKSIFKKMRERLQQQLDEFELTSKQKKIFLDKIGNLNTYSQKDKMDFFCNDISLSLSNIEKTAWQQRNDAAHGNAITDVNQAWKNTLVLRELFNKFLLKLITSNKYYLSYLDGKPEIKAL
ncbi:hypothetical protein ACS125_15980 [Acinetobacter sp. PFS20]|uniref:hypothetical protein n=1 Tax=Acinetobacter sp. PFS20 TaxID=3458434 RepID=UPI003FD256AE